MRLALLLLAVLLLSGCLDAPRLEGSLDESRRELADAREETAALRAETRALADRLRAEENASALAGAQRDDTAGLLEVARAELAAAHARIDALADVEARLFAAENASLSSDANALRGELIAARAELNATRERYEALQAGRLGGLTSVHNGNMTWQFVDLRGDVRQWRIPMESYREAVKRPRPMDNVYITTSGGANIRVPDPRPYVDQDAFAPYVAQLTDGRTDREFVREALNMKRQLVTYGFALVDVRGYYKHPVESLAEASGVCGDTVILVASLLAAGEAQKDYGIETALWIAEWDVAGGRLVRDAQSVNHGYLEVRFADGETWYVETTSYELFLHAEPQGWRYPIEA